MKLLNSLTNKTEQIEPLKDGQLSIYTCGPTVYDSAHIGNLMSYIFADTLARVARSEGYKVQHVMNITDIDDKTIKASECHKCPTGDHNGWLKNYTVKITDRFYEHLDFLNIDRENYQFLLATDHIKEMTSLITELEEAGIAYASDDGIYFSISEYKKKGKKYGQLVNITAESTGSARIDNDEYDKDNIHDFALWKKKKEKEPFWTYESNKTKMDGRPGWHIECSAMSSSSPGLPFDIHTGGVDLKFPHHENEIAQSTATTESGFAKYFTHNEHVLINGTKMSKSKNNFYTLEDLQDKEVDPLAFRLLVLRSKYNNNTNFTWDILNDAQDLLMSLRNSAALRHQPNDDSPRKDNQYRESIALMSKALTDDLNTPKALSIVQSLFDGTPPNSEELEDYEELIKFIDSVFGLDLMSIGDITNEQKQLIEEREAAKKNKDYAISDKLRDELLDQGIEVRDTTTGTIWSNV